VKRLTNHDISPLESIYNIIHYWLQKEIHPEGLLSDVSLLINSSARYDHLDAPLLWIEKQEVTPTVISHSNHTSLKVPVSIICCDEVIDTETEAEASAINLACRCITAYYLNITNPRPMGQEVTLTNFKVERIYPHIPTTGSFDITSKTMMMAAARVDLIFTFDIDWTRYETVVEDEYQVVDYITYGDNPTGYVIDEFP